MRKPSASTVVIALLLGVLLGVAFSNILTAKSSAEVSSNTFPHLAFVGVESRIYAIDLRSGDAWVVDARLPQQDWSNGQPHPPSSTYQGNLGLHRLDESKAITLKDIRR